VAHYETMKIELVSMVTSNKSNKVTVTRYVTVIQPSFIHVNQISTDWEVTEGNYR